MASSDHRVIKPEYVYEIPVPNQPSQTIKRMIPRGWPGTLIMRSKTYRENTHQEVKKEIVEVQQEVVSSRKSLSEVSSRKSVSSIKEVKGRLSVSQVESLTNVESMAVLLNVKVLVSDMPGFMQLHAFRCARTTYDSLDKFSSKHMAYNVKKEFDKVYGPAWHCIVGSSFSSFVTHSTGCFLYFSMEKLCILVFKTKVQKALHS